jgi:hypothetical protein
VYYFDVFLNKKHFKNTEHFIHLYLWCKGILFYPDDGMFFRVDGMRYISCYILIFDWNNFMVFSKGCFENKTGFVLNEYPGFIW